MIRRLVFVLFFALATGCHSSVAIRDIVNNPRNYNGQEVTLSGNVKDAVSMVFMQYFVLADEAGNQIPVITESGLPARGKDVKVTGTINSAFSIGAQTWTVLVEKKDN